jgi:hypothetical protein
LVPEVAQPASTASVAKAVVKQIELCMMCSPSSVQNLKCNNRATTVDARKPSPRAQRLSNFLDLIATIGAAPRRKPTRSRSPARESSELNAHAVPVARAMPRVQSQELSSLSVASRLAAFRRP